MGSKVTVDLSGVRARRASIMPRVKDAIKVAAFRIQARSQDLVPVDTGATKNSIHPEFSDSGLQADIGPTTEYAWELEFGHLTSKGRRVAGRPYMVPSLEAERKPFEEAVRWLVKQG